MERQSSSDGENKVHENDPLQAPDSFPIESPSLAAEAMASCHDPESLNDKRKLSTSDAGNPEQFKHLSPTTKKKRASTNSDINGCKGCKCKKSQCLKLYCECFAAGIFCADPCSCQGCLNVPEYEGTILGIKKQIEYRDRYAFVPKIVPQSTALASSEDNVEDANVVIASSSRARHKKGCNCKKSMCQKKYCECYRANVGCCNACRCEGCNNGYGSGTVEGDIGSAHGFPLSKERESIKKNENGLKDSHRGEDAAQPPSHPRSHGTKDYVVRAPLDRSSPCSSTGSSNTNEWTDTLQSRECICYPSSSVTLRNGFGEDDNAQRFQEEIVPSSTNPTDHQQQMWPTMGNQSCNINMPSNQDGHAPCPSNERSHEGLVLQPQFRVPGHQHFLPQNIENHIAPQPNLVPLVPSLLLQNHRQNIGQNYIFTGSQRQMLGMQQQVDPQELWRQQQSQNRQRYLYQQQLMQQQQQQQQPIQWLQPSMTQAYFLPSLLQQPNNVQHSTDQFILQQHPLAMSQQHQQQQSSIVHQQQTPMTLTQQRILREQRQNQLIGPRSNATNSQVHSHMLRPPNNVGAIEQTRGLLSQQNNIRNPSSQFPPPSSK